MPCTRRLRTMATTISVVASAGVCSVPGNSDANGEGATGSDGSTSTCSPRPASRSSPARAIASAMTTSLPDGPDFVAAFFGVLSRGSVVVMVNPDAPPDLHRYFFEYTRAAAAFVPSDRCDRFDRAAAGLLRPPRVYAVGAHDVAARLGAQPGELAPFDSHRDEPAIWLFSGGTTGPPKAVVQSHRSFVNTTQRSGQGILRNRSDDVTIAVPKLFFGYATGSNVLFPFSVGASCVLFPERCTPDTLFSHIARHRPTILVNVPTMIQQMLAHADA